MCLIPTPSSITAKVMDLRTDSDPTFGDRMHRWVFEQSPIATAVLDATMRVIDCNEAMARLIGSPKERIVGLHIEDMRDQRYRTAVQEALAGNVVAYESPYHATTSNVWLWTRAMFAPIRDNSGCAVAVMALLGDALPQLIAETMASSGDEHLVEAQRLGQVGSWTWDMVRDVADASPEFYRILGVGAGALGRPRDFEHYIHADDRAVVRAHLDAIRKSRLTHTTCDFRVLRSDGAIRFIIMRAFVKYDAHGRPCAAWGTLQDVTERRELEEQLKRAQRMEALGQLASGVAHDFNNLLTVIGVEAELLSEGLGRDNPLNSEVEAIHKATKGAAALTRQLLAFSGRQILRQRRLDLNELVTETVRMLERLIGKDIELATVLEPNLPPILGDAGQLEQVLVNLAVNARDAMPEGGVLTIVTEWTTGGDDVSALPASEYVILTVADTGQGMDESVRRRIFDPFFTTKPPERGTGLGLSTVLGIVERSGGRIMVVSEPGRGTRFTIHLPRAYAGDEAAESQSRRERRRAKPAARTTVLLVEDELPLRAVLERMLRRAGYHVLVAEDGYSALTVAQAFDGRIDLVITDVILPQFSSRDMVARLTEARPEVRVLYMSGYPEDEILRRGLLDDTANLLEKPFSGLELAEATREALRFTD